MLKSIGICKTCRSALIAPDASPDEEDSIYFRAYSQKALLRPWTKFSYLFNLCYQVAHFYIVELINKDNIKSRILSLLHKKINFDKFPKCDKHDLFSMFLKLFLQFYLYTYAGNVNNILKGNVLENINNNVKKQALVRYRKYKKK